MQAYLAQIESKSLKIILGLIVFVIAAALHSYLIWPNFKEYRQLKQSHDLLQSAVSNDHNLQQDLDKITVQVQELKKRLHGDMADLPQKQFESYIIGQLQSIAWNNGVELIGVKPKKGERVDQFREILFDIDIRGDYFHIFDLLSEVGDTLGFVVIKRCSMKSDNVTKGSPSLQVKVTIASYRIEA